MDLDHTQDEDLHYKMLEFLYEKQNLPSSCFSHCWEDFKTSNPDVLISADRLKALFWRNVMPNVANYNFRDAEMKYYFHQDNIFLEVADENLSHSMVCNETKAGGRSFILCKSTVEHLKSHGTLADVEKSFKKPNRCQGVFGFESDDDSDEECIRIKKDRPPVIKENDTVEGNLELAFNAFLRLPNESFLKPEDVKQKLSDKNAFSSLDDIKNMPVGVQEFLQEMKFFKDLFPTTSRASSISNQSSEKENENQMNTQNSLIVPEIPMSSDRRLRSRNSQDSIFKQRRENLANQSSSQPTPVIPRTKFSTPQSRKRTNLRMETFAAQFNTKASKRQRRSYSASPI